jgi:flagellar FliL protein
MKWSVTRSLLIPILILSFSLVPLTGLAQEGGGEGEGKADAAGPQYLPLEGVLVNLEGRRHYLRVEIQLLVDDGAHAAKIKEHLAPIRHALIMLLSGHNPEQIAQAEEREKLRQAAKAEITKVLAARHADKGLTDVFFTDYLIQ